MRSDYVHRFEKLRGKAIWASREPEAAACEQPLLQRAAASVAALARLPSGVDVASGDEGALLQASAALGKHQLGTAVLEVQKLASMRAQHVLHTPTLERS